MSLIFEGDLSALHEGVCRFRAAISPGACFKRLRRAVAPPPRRATTDSFADDQPTRRPALWGAEFYPRFPFPVSHVL